MQVNLYTASMYKYITDQFLGEHVQFSIIGADYSELYEIPYDYGSVMHYFQYAFTNNSQPTIITKDPTFQNIIGKAKTASQNDYKKICGIYGCSKCLGIPWQPNRRKNGSRSDESEENDEEETSNSHCAQCNPIGECSKSYKTMRNYYNALCCGNCGKKWWRNWCNRLSPNDLVVWRQKEMCE